MYRIKELFRNFTYLLPFLFLYSNSVSASVDIESHPFRLFGYVENNNFSVPLSIRWSGGLPLIDVVIDGESYTFLFDTGSPTVIPTKLANSKELKILHTDELFDPSGKAIKKHIYQLPLLTIGDIDFREFAVVDADFSQIFPMSCLGFDGILGYNILKDLIVTLNFDNSEVTLSDQREEVGADFIETDLLFDNSHIPKIKLMFPFGEGLFGVDTGYNGAIIIGNPNLIHVFKKLQYPYRTKHGVSSATISGTNKKKESVVFLIKDFSIDGSISIANAPAHIESGASLIGNGLLKNFVVITDFRNKKAYFKKLGVGDVSIPFRDTFGFSTFWDNERGLYISAIMDHTPVSETVLEIGDKVLAINDMNTSHFSKDDYCGLIRVVAGDEESYDTRKSLKLTVEKKDGNRKNILLTKKFTATK